MSTTNNDLIIQSIEQMNLSLLDVLLDDNKIYNETTKQIFLEKIEKIFKVFKRYNNTELITHIGFCSGTNQGCKTGVINCSGYTFRGNNSKLYISFAFIYDDIDIVDLRPCCSMQNIDFEADDTFKLSYRIFEDEKVNFLPNDNYNNQTTYWLSVLEDLHDFKTQIMDFNFCNFWLEKYRIPLYSYDLYYYDFKLFYKLISIYNSLDSLYKALSFVDILQVACAEFENIIDVNSIINEELENIKIDNIYDLIKWNDKYYKLSYNKLGFDIKNCKVSFSDIDKTDFIFIKEYKLSFKELRICKKFEYHFSTSETLIEISIV